MMHVRSLVRLLLKARKEKRAMIARYYAQLSGQNSLRGGLQNFAGLLPFKSSGGGR